MDGFLFQEEHCRESQPLLYVILLSSNTVVSGPRPLREGGHKPQFLQEICHPAELSHNSGGFSTPYICQEFLLISSVISLWPGKVVALYQRQLSTLPDEVCFSFERLAESKEASEPCPVLLGKFFATSDVNS